MKCAKKLRFSPIAWAKIRWMMIRAGELEMSGFGLSAPDEPFSVIDFNTILQECESAETEMDDRDLSRYMERMAKNGIAPCRCMRIWIHSHPFAASKPSPSGTDTTTLEEKTGANSEWAIMVIVGQGPTFARLHIRPALLDNEPIEMEMQVEVDWTLLATSEVLKDWKKEFKRNIHEAPKPIPVVATPSRKAPSLNLKRLDKYRVNKRGQFQDKWKKTFREYRREWDSYDLKGQPKWAAPPGNMTIWEYIAAREEDFTQEEIGQWGDLVLACDRETLQLSWGDLEKQAGLELAEIRRRAIP